MRASIGKVLRERQARFYGRPFNTLSGMPKDAPKRSQLAATISALRTRKQWSHETLAVHASKLLPQGKTLSAKTVGNVEADRHDVTLGKLKAIAAALGVEVWQLFLPLPPSTDLIRDITLEISARSEDDQRDTLKLIRKFPVVVPGAPSPAVVADRPTPPAVRRAAS